MTANPKPAPAVEPPSPFAALDAAITARCLASAKREQSTCTLDRARQEAHRTAEEVLRLALIEENARAAHAQKYERWIVDGATGPEPTQLVDVKAVAARERARSAAEAASRAFASLEATHAELMAAEAFARAAVEVALTAVLCAEGDALAAEILKADAQSRAARERLAALSIARPAALSLQSRRVIERPNTLSPPAWYLDELLGANGPHRGRIATAEGVWNEHIAALREGREAV